MSSSRVFVAPSGLRGLKGDKGEPGNPGGGTPGQGVPTGGTTGQILAKVSATNYDTTWINPPTGTGTGLPNGGTTGQTLVKNSGTNGDAGWATPLALETAGTPAALGTAARGTDADAAHSDHVHAMPRLDQVLAPTTDVSMGLQKLINGEDGVLDTDFATVGQVNVGLDDKLNTADLITAVLALFDGITISKDYNDATDAWPTLNSTLAASTSVAWLFGGADESAPPPTTIAGPAKWVRNLA